MVHLQHDLPIHDATPFLILCTYFKLGGLIKCLKFLNCYCVLFVLLFSFFFCLFSSSVIVTYMLSVVLFDIFGLGHLVFVMAVTPGVRSPFCPLGLG